MSFFSFFSSSNKQSSKQAKIKIYKDVECQNYFQNIIIEENTQCKKVLDQIATQVQQGEEIRKVLLLFTCQNRKVISQRIINKQEQIAKIIQNTPPNIENYIVYQEIKVAKLQESQAYHSKTWNPITITQKDHSFRQGTLMKKGKNGQFRERLFKLQKDTLIYEKHEKNDKKTKQSCISLDSMQIEKQADKSLQFQIKCDQKIYIIKAQSRTDFDGWLYSLHNQIMKWKEVKLLLDYDKKIESFSLKRVENLKNLPKQFKSIKEMASTKNNITKQFENFLSQKRTKFDLQIYNYLQLCQEVEQVQQLGSRNMNIVIEKREQKYIEILNSQEKDENFPKEKLSQSQFKQEAISFQESYVLPLFCEEVDQKQLILDFLIHQFKQFFEFPLPDSSQFYNEIELEKNSSQQ